MKLLIADDEEPVLRMIRRFVEWEAIGLEECGTASDGDELYQKIKETHPDIVLTDITMPGMNGLEVIARCMEEEIMPRFIILSAYATFEYARQALRLGVDEFLTKPIQRRELNQTLKNSAEKIKKDNTQEYAESQVINHACEYIEMHFDEQLQMTDVAGQVFLSSNYFSHLFRLETGKRFTEYLTDVRIKHAKKWLKDPEYTVDMVASMCGYDDARYFSRVFKTATESTPQEWKNK
jgi:two-component system response regulator YesN